MPTTAHHRPPRRAAAQPRHRPSGAVLMIAVAASYAIQPLPWRRGYVARAALWWRWLRRRGALA